MLVSKPRTISKGFSKRKQQIVTFPHVTFRLWLWITAVLELGTSSFENLKIPFTVFKIVYDGVNENLSIVC